MGCLLGPKTTTDEVPAKKTKTEERTNDHVGKTSISDHGKASTDYLNSLDPDIAREALSKKKNSQDFDILTDDEMVALHAYTTGYYEDINPLMRSDSIDGTPWKSVAVSANSALEKLQKVDGRIHSGAAFRGMSDLDDAAVNNLFKKGEIFSDPAFTSSSATSDAAFNGNVKIEIKSKNGVKVHDASFFPEEEEVLFRPNTKFDVKECTKTPSGTWEVKLEEI